jgi:hypothetical protein
MNIDPSSAYEGAVYTGHDVIDEQGNQIGRVTDVLYDDDGGPVDASAPEGVRRPSWLVVDPGLLRAAHYVPVAGSYRTAEGTIVTPWDKDWVKAALKASHDHILTRDEREELLAHYALAE